MSYIYLKSQYLNKQSIRNISQQILTYMSQFISYSMTHYLGIYVQGSIFGLDFQ